MLPTVEVYKMLPDGSQWGRFQGYHLPISSACPIVWSPLGTEMRWRPAVWHTKTHGLAFFWPGRWYVIHAFYDAAGDFAGCYCDIVTPNPPVSPNAPEMRYTDLYIDVVVRADHSVFTKDEEVYARAMQVNPTLAALRDEAFSEMDRLAEHARAWTGPFVPVVEHLARTDWQTLDPAGPEFAAARANQWNGLF